MGQHHTESASVSLTKGKGCSDRALVEGGTGPQTVPPIPRKTHCIRGHAYTPENTIITSQGKRQCRSCKRLAGKKYLARQRNGYRRYKAARGEARVLPLVREIFSMIEAQRLSLRLMARKSGYFVRNFERWRRGDVIPSAATMIDLYNALGYDLVPVKREKQ